MASLPTHSYRNRLPELAQLEALLTSLKNHARVEVLDTVRHNDLQFPLYGIVLGSNQPEAPTLGLFGGVHGLERIGSQVVLSYLETLASLLKWDETLQEQLSEIRLVFMPIVNPVGMYLQRRSNGNHVDLMRSSPTQAENSTLLVGGHRISPLLPWYRGEASAPMQAEAAALCGFVEKEVLTSRASITLDVHSGFGFMDQIWFPYAKTRVPFPHLPETHALKKVLDETLPNHVYKFEPQAKNYVTHGDLWDYLYEKQRARSPDNIYLPLTLELGSWLWLRKNPVQLFSFLGPFNPVKPHRRKRTLRRHLPLIDFLVRTTRSNESWSKLTPEVRDEHRKEAMLEWYHQGK